MFSGIVEKMCTVAAIENYSKGKRLYVNLGRARTGESIAINGVCLTATKSKKAATFDLMPETLKRTNLGALKKGDKVNIDRSLKLSDRNSGHFVMGHVDGIGKMTKRENFGDFSNVWIKCSKNLMKYVAEKGSIAVDGVSLTVVDVGKDWFSVSLIPHTLAITTLGMKGKGDAVNIEIDMLARYVRKMLNGR